MGTLRVMSQVTLQGIPRYTLHENAYCTTVDACGGYSPAGPRPALTAQAPPEHGTLELPADGPDAVLFSWCEWAWALWASCHR